MFSHRRAVRIEWGDCDPAGIVWYPRYFGLFDASTQRLFEAAGFPKQELRARFGVLGYPMADTRAAFKAPTRYGDDVVIESRIARLGRASFEVEHRLLKDGALAVEAWETRVLAREDPETGAIKAAPLPPEVAAALARPAEDAQ